MTEQYNEDDVDQFIHDIGFLFGDTEFLENRKVKIEEVQALLRKLNLTPNDQLTTALQWEIDDEDKGWTLEDRMLLRKLFPNLR